MKHFNNVEEYEKYMAEVCKKNGIEYSFFNWFWNFRYDGTEEIIKKALADDGYDVEHPLGLQSEA